MDCDPQSLIESSKANCCVPEGVMGSVNIKSLCDSTNAAPVQACQHDTVDDWKLRVVINGGASPGQTTLDALCEFMTGLDDAGLTPKILALNPFVPDNLTAALTPLIVGVGIDPWTNLGSVKFQAADISVNGLQGANQKYLDSGVNTTSLGAFNHGWTIYVQSGANSTHSEVGAWATTNPPGYDLQLYNNNCVFDSNYNGSVGRVSVAAVLYTGYLSANRVAANDQRVFRASSTVPHAVFVSGASLTTDQRAGVNNTFYVFAAHTGATASNIITKRLSFCAFHSGLSAAESNQFHNLVYALRVSLGGGYV